MVDLFHDIHDSAGRIGPLLNMYIAVQGGSVHFLICVHYSNGVIGPLHEMYIRGEVIK